MTNRKLLMMALLCLMVNPMVAMKRIGSVMDSPPCKRLKLDDIAPNGKENQFASILADVPKFKPSIFDIIDNGHFFELCVLMPMGTNPNKLNPIDGNPLLLTAWLSDFTLEQKIEIYHVLKSQGADIHVVTANTGTSLLHLAVLAGDVSFVRRLVLDGVDVHLENFEGETPLFYAQTPEMINELARHGADVNHQDYRGRTPLFGVAGIKTHDCAEKLVLWRTDCEITDDKGRTAYVWQEDKFGDANPAIRSNRIARDAMIMPAVVRTIKGNLASFVLGRPVDGRIMTTEKLATY